MPAGKPAAAMPEQRKGSGCSYEFVYCGEISWHGAAMQRNAIMRRHAG